MLETNGSGWQRLGLPAVGSVQALIDAAVEKATTTLSLRHAVDLEAVRLAGLREGERLARERIGKRIGVLYEEDRVP